MCWMPSFWSHVLGLVVCVTGCGAGSATEGGVPEPPPKEPVRARFLAVGDVIFGRGVQKILDEKKDREHPFRPLAKLYAQVDFTFANLENPFFSGSKPNVTPPGKVYAVLRARPEHATTLAKYGFTAVNLANNHAMDQGALGLQETIRTLDAQGIAHVGAGMSLDEAWKPMIVDVRGLKIAFVGASYTSRNDLDPSWKKHVARIEDEQRLAAACKAAREEAHFVVVTFHAGDEHKLVPNAQQRTFARAAVRAGADIVLGAHPHVVQPAEKIDGKWVFFSLGNFIFDQPAWDNSEARLAASARTRRPTPGLGACGKSLALRTSSTASTMPGHVGARASWRSPLIMSVRCGDSGSSRKYSLMACGRPSMIRPSSGLMRTLRPPRECAVNGGSNQVSLACFRRNLPYPATTLGKMRCSRGSTSEVSRSARTRVSRPFRCMSTMASRAGR